MQEQFTYKHLENYARNHPISLTFITAPFYFFGIFALILWVFYRFGLNADFIQLIIGENMAPNTIFLLNSILLIALLVRLLSGRRGFPEWVIAKSFVKGNANFLLGAQASILGIQLAKAFVATLPDTWFTKNIVDPGWATLAKTFFEIIFNYALYLCLTIDRNAAPAFSTRRFNIGYISLCWFLFVMLIGQSIFYVKIVFNGRVPPIG